MTDPTGPDGQATTGAAGSTLAPDPSGDPHAGAAPGTTVVTSPNGATAAEIPSVTAHVRRPADVIRLVVIVAVLVVGMALADVAVGTADALEGDLATATGGLPRLLLTILGWVSGLGFIVLPVLLAADLVWHRRIRQLIEAVVASAVSALLVLGLVRLILDGTAGTILSALTRPLQEGRTSPLDPVTAVLMTFLTVSRIRGRNWSRWLAGITLVSMVVTGFLSGTVTALALVVSILLGWAIGLAFRVALGTTVTLPPAEAIRLALQESGLHVETLSSIDEPADLRGAADGDRVFSTYRVGHGEGDAHPEPLRIYVVDRDTFGGSSVLAFVRRLRLRAASTRKPSLSIRDEMEHRSLMMLALQRFGVSAPRLQLAVPVGGSSFAMAVSPYAGQTLAEAGADTSDAQLDAVWRLIARLEQVRISHRDLAAGVIVLPPSLAAASLQVASPQVASAETSREAASAVSASAPASGEAVSSAAAGGGHLASGSPEGPMAGLLTSRSGDLAAEDLTLRLDLAQALVAVAGAVGAERAVTSAVAFLGPETVRRALPVLQTIALGPLGREELKAGDEPKLLDRVRDHVADLLPEEPDPAPIELRRVTPRTLLMIFGGGMAIYLVMTKLVAQLGQVDIPSLVRSASLPWVLACLLFAATTFAGPALSITGAVEKHISYMRTYLTQLAVAFSGLVAPGAVGNIALNTRFLVKSGVPTAVAGASVALVQVMQMCSYVVLIVLAGVLAGTGTQASFTPPAALVAAIPIVILVVVALLAVPKVRAWVSARVMPQLRIVGPQILRVFQQPQKLLRMVAGSLMLDASFAAALICATRAFGAHPPLAAVAVVYFAGAIIGSAVPTPGGLGGIELAISSGLIGIGMDAGTAVAAVLLYRLFTYWLPIPFGWAAVHRLQKLDAI